MRLSWPGRRWRGPGWEAPEPSTLRPFESAPDSEISAARLVLGEAAAAARALCAAGVRGNARLVYLDPPYGSMADYSAETRFDGKAGGDVKRTRAYTDTWTQREGGLGPYLEMLAESLDAMLPLLRKDGVMCVHVDYRASHYVRLILEELMGASAFRNEIVWKRAPNLGRQAASGQYGRTLDTLLLYGMPHAKIVPDTRLEEVDRASVRRGPDGEAFTLAPRGDYTDASIERLEREGRVHRSPSGKVYIKYALTQLPSGAWARERPVDALWTDIAPMRHSAAKERTGFPTQKPLALLERVIRSTTEEGDLVVDLFSGSGSTAVAALGLKREVIAGDASGVALWTCLSRLRRVGRNASVDVIHAPDVHDDPHCVRIARMESGAVHVELAEGREPLAWAVDTHEREVFSPSWHSERPLTGGQRRVERTVVLEAWPKVVRLYEDDGKVLEARVAEGI